MIDKCFLLTKRKCLCLTKKEKNQILSRLKNHPEILESIKDILDITEGVKGIEIASYISRPIVQFFCISLESYCIFSNANMKPKDFLLGLKGHNIMDLSGLMKNS